MFHRMKRVLSLSVVLSLFCVPFVQADATADLKELHQFQLTEKRLDQFMQALRNMAEAIQKNPEAAKQDNSVSANASIQEMAAVFEKNPLLKKSVEAAGMTPREFVLFQMALFSAAMGHWVVEQGHKLPAEFSAEHVKFYKDHEEKFKTLQKEWEEIGKKMNPKESEEQPEEEEYEESEE